MVRLISQKRMVRLIAQHKDVQADLDRRAATRAARARAILKIHRHDGHSFIEVLRGDIDRWIVLNDENGQKAAMTIEFGRKNGGRFGPMEAVAPLRKAVGLL